MRAIGLLLLFVTPAAAEVWDEPSPAVEALRAAVETARAEAAKTDEKSPLRGPLERRVQLLEQWMGHLERAPVVVDSKAADALAAEAKALTELERAPEKRVEQATPEGLEVLEREETAARRAVDEVRAERAALEARLEAMPDLLEKARQREKAARARVSSTQQAVAKAAEPDAEAAAKAINARIEVRVAEAQLAALTRDADQRAALEILDARLDLAERRLRLKSEALSAYRTVLERQLANSMTALRAAVESARAAVAAQAPGTPEHHAADTTLRLAQAALEAADADRLRLDLEQELTQARDRLAVERSELEGIRSAVLRDPGSSRTARRLKETFQRLQRRQQQLEREAETQASGEIADARGRRLEIGDQLAGLNSDWTERIGVFINGLPEARRAAARRALDERREALRTALRRESAALGALIGTGESLRAVQAERATVFAELDRVVRTRIFWVQDAQPLWADLSQNGAAELRRLLDWTRALQGEETLDALSAVTEEPVELILAICALVVLPILLVVARRRLLPFLQENSTTVRGRIRRVGAGLLLASLAPASLWLVANLLSRSALPPEIRPMLVALFEHGALCLWIWLLVRLFLGAQGVLATHFGVGEVGVVRAARLVRLVVLGYAFCLLPARLIAGPPLHATAVSRFAWLAFGGVVLLAVAGLLRRRGPFMQLIRRILDERSERASLVDPVRLLVIAAVAGIIIMDVAGYRYGAAQLARGLFLSLLVVVPLVLFWRPLGLAWSRWRRDEDDTAPVDAPPRWFKAVAIIVGVLLLALVWGIDRGAVRLLDGIHLYNFEDDRHISLLDVASAVLVLVVAGWAIRGLPRVMKRLVFPYFNLDDGLQYAVVTIAQYVLAFIGLLAGFSTLKVDLGSLGWLMAALGVGLGFGLQEIVSNFVSGIILLVERPLRVGDFVSVGALEGRVVRINIRATTLLSLDRREIIVPNRDLITKEVTNWTHGDQVVRITVDIGVAYGSDVVAVTKLLTEVANADADVLQAPPAEVIFAGHGDSSLDFEVRMHVPNPWIRFKVIHRINSAINRALAEHDIEIPFPQRDLHIRSSVIALAGADD